MAGQETSTSFCVDYAFSYCVAIGYPKQEKYPNVSFALCPKLCWKRNPGLQGTTNSIHEIFASVVGLGAAQGLILIFLTSGRSLPVATG